MADPVPAAKKYYAWSPITSSHDELGRDVFSAQPGDEVSASKLNLTEDQFQELVDGGSVRTKKFPDMDSNFDGSPADWYRQQAKEEG